MSHFNMDILRANLLRAEPYGGDDGEGEYVSECIGSVFSVMPSGKFYTPWAYSNVDPCPVCHGKGDMANPRANGTRLTTCSNLASEMRATAVETYGAACNGEWPEDLRATLRMLDKLVRRYRARLDCWRCDGCGSAEAADDDRAREEMERELARVGCWLESGEGDPTDLFVVTSVDNPWLTGEDAGQLALAL